MTKSTGLTISRRGVLSGAAALAGTTILGTPKALLAGGHAAPLPFASPPVAQAASGKIVDQYKALLNKDYPDKSVPDTVVGLGCRWMKQAAYDGKTLRVPVYEDMSATPAPSRIVGPTIELTRGRTTGVYLKNRIELCGADAISEFEPSESGWKPHGFTNTNLHTHGLHVTPQAPSDDVLITIDSEAMAHAGHGGHSAHHSISSTDDPTAFPYRYEVPGDHPVGTFWYHPHKHGSVAAQVGPGMAGALIIRSNTGQVDFDEVLANDCNITTADEEVMVLQTIPFFEVEGQPDQGVFYPYGYYVGSLEKEFEPSSCHGLTPKKGTGTSGTLSVNGLVNPKLTMRPGEIKRLRIVNATNGNTVVPMFEGVNDSKDVPEIYAIATDGIALLPPTEGAPADTPYYQIDYGLRPDNALTEAQKSAYWTNAELITVAPGQRVDLLIRAGAAGTFQLKGAAKGEAPTVVEVSSTNTDPILTIEVTGEARSDQKVPTIALYQDERIQRPVVPEVAIDGRWPQATQSIEFKTIDQNFHDVPIPSAPAFVINDQYFDAELGDPAQIQLYKGDTDVWNLYSTSDAHIFHIHINSFQALARSSYDKARRVYEPPVAYQMPIWRDTIYFDGGQEKGGGYVPGTMVVMASKQVDFTGEFVMHCHNLFHEDNGMMMTVSILDPETGGIDKT